MILHLIIGFLQPYEYLSISNIVKNIFRGFSVKSLTPFSMLYSPYIRKNLV